MSQSTSAETPVEYTDNQLWAMFMHDHPEDNSAGVNAQEEDVGLVENQASLATPAQLYPPGMVHTGDLRIVQNGRDPDINNYPEPNHFSQELHEPKQSDVSKRLKCKHRGCPNRTGFGRKAELERHMMTCHAPNGDYAKCPMLDCDKSYPRDDKFRLHLMKHHSVDDLGMCSIIDCDNPGPHPLDLLRVHAAFHADWSPAKSALSGWRWFNRSCLIGSCKALVEHDKLQAHLHTHDVNQRKEHRDAIEQWGYDAVTMKLICPICKERLSDRAQVARHTKESHLRDAMVSKAKPQVRLRYIDRRPVGKLWRSLPFLGTFEYPGDGVDSVFDHQEIRALQVLYPWRRELLRLFPEIDCHIMFHDIFPKEGGQELSTLENWGYRLIGTITAE